MRSICSDCRSIVIFQIPVLTIFSSVVQLRTTVDENLTTSLSALGYNESFTLIDTRLALGYLTALIAAGLYFVDKKYGFDKTFNITVAAVVAYFAISGILWYYTSTAQYKNVKYVGYSDKKEKITVATWTSKYDPVYHVKITTQGQEITTEFEFMKLFDGMGYYKEEQLTNLLKAELEKVNKKSI